MDGLSSMFKKSKTGGTPRNIDEKSVDEIKYDMTYLRSKDLTRKNFNYDQIAKLGWWPDKILKFIEVLRIGYNEFIQVYISSPDIFDVPIRNAIFFMNQKKYNKMGNIIKFLRNGNYEISDSYLLKVLNEDNCYFGEFEIRKRSDQESKHYLLFKALTQLLKCGTISDEDFTLKQEYETLLRLYVIIYNVKNAYSMLDDLMRNLLGHFVEGTSLDIPLVFTIYGLIKDVEETTFEHIKKIRDTMALTKVCILRDILLFALNELIQFNSVYITTEANNLNDVVISKGVIYSDIYTLDVLDRIKQVNSYFMLRLKNIDIKSRVIIDNPDYFKMLSALQKKEIPIVSPRYTLKFDDDSSFFVDIIGTPKAMEERPTTPRLSRPSRKVSQDDAMVRPFKHVRKNTSEGLMSPRASEDVPTSTSTGTPRQDVSSV